jgi:hypothetical protein
LFFVLSKKYWEVTLGEGHHVSCDLPVTQVGSQGKPAVGVPWPTLGQAVSKASADPWKSLERSSLNMSCSVFPLINWNCSIWSLDMIHHTYTYSITESFLLLRPSGYAHFNFNFYFFYIFTRKRKMKIWTSDLRLMRCSSQLIKLLFLEGPNTLFN